MSLVVDWCSYDACRYAVTRWHYSRTMPTGKLAKLGAWEDGQFIGCVIFGRGSARFLGAQFDLDATEVCELVRVALTDHHAPVSQIVARALAKLREHNPGLRLVISFADSGQGHHGGIYQAGNWTYLGEARSHTYRVLGRLRHPRTLHVNYGIGGQSVPWLREHVDPNAERVELPAKHKYAMGLDRRMRRVLRDLAVPYPSASSGTIPA